MIHIIDDDQNVREGYEILLKSANFKYKSYSSPEEFLKNYQLGDNDLLILDMHSKNVSGCSLLENLTKKKINLPVIVITAYHDQTTRNCARKYGAIAYLRKPIDSEALIDIINYNLKSKISH